MSTDAIKQVLSSEEQARAGKQAAQAQAQAILAQAQQEAAQRSAQADRETREQVKALLERERAQAEEAGRATLAGFDAQCEELKAQAGKKLDEAAAVIVRRVVSS